MEYVRYLLVVVLVGALAIVTINEHVERTRIGYELRQLEREEARLLEEDKATRLEYEQAIVRERLIERAVALGVAGEPELNALTGS